MPANLFFSYSHKDEALRDELETHLAMLKRQRLIEAWHDRRIAAGDELDEAIDANLERADVILFLASPDFLASEYCYGVEVARAMQRHESGSTRVVPVILRPCEWQQAPFGSLLATPKDGRPVTRWPDKDEAFQDVVRSIRAAIPKEVSSEAARSASRVPRGLTADEFAVAADANNDRDRSSNLRVSKSFTQRDRDDLLSDTFAYIERFFEASLEELEKRNAGIETRFRRIDADRFTATIYQSGSEVSACTIFRGGLGGRSTDICYSMSANAPTNGYNEALSVESDEQSLFLTALGMAHIARCSESGREKLTQEGAAELFWSILLEPLQRQ